MKYHIILTDRHTLGAPQKLAYARGTKRLLATERVDLAREFDRVEGEGGAVEYLAGLPADPRWFATVVEEGGRVVMAAPIGCPDGPPAPLGSLVGAGETVSHAD